MRCACRYLLWLALLGCLPSATWAQYQLVLEKPNSFKRIHLNVGDEFGLRVQGMDRVYVGELQGVKLSQIYMFGDSIDPQTLDRIHLPRPRNLTNMMRGALIMAAVVAPVMLLLNLPHDQWTWTKAGKLAGFSATALLTSQFLKHFYWHRIRLGNGKWRLRIMPTPESSF